MKKYIKTFESYNDKLIAPNGSKSNLSKELYYMVRTTEFKDWFGDWENNTNDSSKVIDENGEPLICYHGTKINFDVFDTDRQKNGWLGKGFYFTDNKKRTKEHGKIILQVFLNIRNPFIVKGEAPSDVISEVKEIYNSSNDDVSITLKDNNHDGIFFKHWEQGNIFTCFNSNQIKIIK